MYATFHPMFGDTYTNSTFLSRVNEDSILAVQVFDQRKFKKKDQGFLGVVNIRIGDAVELLNASDGKQCFSIQPRSPHIQIAHHILT